MRRPIVIAALCAVCTACSGKSSSGSGAGLQAVVPDAASAPVDAHASQVDAATPAGAQAAQLFADSTRSLKLKRSIAVRMEPHKDAERYGTIAAGTWVSWQRAIEVDETSGCSARWIEIKPFGWICEQLLKPSERPPKGVELPRLERAELVPGVYGKVIGEQPTTYYKEGEGEEIEMVPARVLEGSVMVRRYGELVVLQAVDDELEPTGENGESGGETGENDEPTDGDQSEAASGAAGAGTSGSERGGETGDDPGEAGDSDGAEVEERVEEVTYWRITQGRKAEYLPEKSLREYRPSTYRGLRLGDETRRSMPVGYPRSEKRLKGKIPVYSAARGGRRVDRVRTRTPVPVLEIARDAKDRVIAYRIGEERWVRARQMLLVEKTAPPPHTGAHERWFDLDLDTQVLVAYEGELPVYTTMMATGSKKHPTGTGIFRIWVKFAEKNMSDLAGEDPYSVATVPWVQFYDKGLALHTSYWHDKFGTRRSHGCTNLAPADARFLYFWSEPSVPPGWSMAKGTVEHAGSMVRIRSRDDPDPQFQGYALEVFRKRQAAQSGRSEPSDPAPAAP